MSASEAGKEETFSGYDAFVSYSRKDAAVVCSVVDRLKAEGYRCWMDVSGIESGDAFKKEIVRAIKASSVVVFFSSENSNASEWTVKEINIAVQLNKVIIPVRLDDVPYDDSIQFDLSGIDYIGLEENDAEFLQTGADKLISALESKCRGNNSSPGAGLSNAVGQEQKVRTRRGKSVSVKMKAWGCSLGIGIFFTICICLSVFFMRNSQIRANVYDPSTNVRMASANTVESLASMQCSKVVKDEASERQRQVDVQLRLAEEQLRRAEAQLCQAMERLRLAEKQLCQSENRRIGLGYAVMAAPPTNVQPRPQSRPNVARLGSHSKDIAVMREECQKSKRAVEDLRKEVEMRKRIFEELRQRSESFVKTSEDERFKGHDK